MIELNERFYRLVADEESISDLNWQGYDALSSIRKYEVSV